MSQATSMRKRHRFNSRMTRIVLLISFIFFFGRFIYSSVVAWQHHQSNQEAQQSTLSVESPVQR
ncbi:YfgG family protein [Escherichia coli]|nr:YfgG family protein [Escherichia coli]